MQAPWEDQEPVDLDYILGDVTHLEIKVYQEFVQKPLRGTSNARLGTLTTNYHKRQVDLIFLTVNTQMEFILGDNPCL